MSTALIVVDVQKKFYSEIPAIQSAFPSLGENISRTLAWAREGNVQLIVHVRVDYSLDNGSLWMPYFYELNPDKKESGTGFEPEPFAEEKLDGSIKELVLKKPTFDAFLNTTLDQILRANKITDTLICGLVTSACVQNTVHGAFARGYRPVVISDCCGDRSVARHEAILDIYSQYMYRLVTSKELVHKRK